MVGGSDSSRLCDITDPDWVDWSLYSGAGPYPELEDCLVYDKIMRGRVGYVEGGALVDNFDTHILPLTYDATQPSTISSTGCSPTISVMGEENQLQPMTAGYAGGVLLEPELQGSAAPHGPRCQPDDNYPWIEGNQVPFPRLGPELSFARAAQEATGDEVVIIKFSISGSSVVLGPAGWHPDQTGVHAYLPVLEDTYFDHTLELIERRRKPGQRVLLGGVVSMIGLTDMRPKNYLRFEDGYRAIIQHMRDDFSTHAAAPATAADVPYLIVHTPTPTVFLRPEDWDRFNVVHGAQALIANELDGVDIVNPDTAAAVDPVHGHFDADGNIAVGELWGSWAAAVADDALELE